MTIKFHKSLYSQESLKEAVKEFTETLAFSEVEMRDGYAVLEVTPLSAEGKKDETVFMDELDEFYTYALYLNLS